jgi:nucleoside-triphosphatase
VLKADAVAIDEIGPMELLSEEFVDAVRKVIAGQKPLIATIHYRVNAPIVGELKSGEEAQLVEVTPKNREQLPALITEKVAELIDAKLNC